MKILLTTTSFQDTPGVHHTTVAEYNFMLRLALEKNFLYHTDSTRSGDAKTNWKRKTGHELLDKTIGIIGLGRIGKEVALSLIHISEPTRLGMISYAVFCLKKK